MLFAINLHTGVKFNARAIGRDASYMQIDKLKLAAPRELIANYDDVLEKNNIEYISVKYIKQHIRECGKGVVVSPHFRICNGKSLGVIMNNESEAHKKIKDFMFNILLNDKIDVKFEYSNTNNTINTISMASLNDIIDIVACDVSTEYDLFEKNIIDTNNNRRADLLIPFKTEHNLLGNGIIIEVQLSSQDKNTLYNRTVERGLKGYSVCWIDKTFFEDINSKQLIMCKLPVIETFHSILYYNKKNMENNYFDNMNKYARKFKIEMREHEEFISRSREDIGLLSICAHCKARGHDGKMIYNKSKTAFKCSNYRNEFLGNCKNWWNIK